MALRAQVKEVLFMNKLTVEDLKITLQMQLAEVDRKIQSGRCVILYHVTSKFMSRSLSLVAG